MSHPERDGPTEESMNEHENKTGIPPPTGKAPPGIEAGIKAMMLSCFALQVLVFLAFSIDSGFFGLYGIPFLLTTTAFHAFLIGVLLFLKDNFYIESTGERLSRVNLANAITLFRISALPTILFLVIAAKDFRIRIPLLVLVMIVFLSDFADGFVSRMGKQATKIGSMLDSGSDYLLLVVLSFAFYYYLLIPGWFLLLVFARLSIQSIMVFILMAVNRRNDSRTSPLGKVAVASLMVLYTAEILEIVIGPPAQEILVGLEHLAALILVASIVDKALLFARGLRTGRAVRASDPSQA